MVDAITTAMIFPVRTIGDCEQECYNTPGSRVCDCYYGYYPNDNLCTDIDECESNNDDCEHSCTNTEGSYYCTCESGFRLADFGLQGQYRIYSPPTRCVDINECYLQIDLCEQQCVNALGSYECSCYDGYTLNGDGQTCDDINECAEPNEVELDCSDDCFNIPGSFLCGCNHGFTLGPDERTCWDNNECLSDNGGCQHVCNNTAGSFYCNCWRGYQLDADSYSCNDINECDLDGDDCTDLCFNTPGSYQCSCPDGYQLDEDLVTCIDFDECRNHWHDCDPISMVCVNAIGNFSCNCRPLYMPSITTPGTCGKLTNNPYNYINVLLIFVIPPSPLFAERPGDDPPPQDPCLSRDCDQICNNTVGVAECSCYAGFRLVDDVSCRDINECATNNGGCYHRCHNTEGDFYCSCKNGYKLDYDGHACIYQHHPATESESSYPSGPSSYSPLYTSGSSYPRGPSSYTPSYLGGSPSYPSPHLSGSPSYPSPRMPAYSPGHGSPSYTPIRAPVYQQPSYQPGYRLG